MKYQNGLRIYGVYRFDKYPDWNILITDLKENKVIEWFEGLAFNSEGDFLTGISLTLPMDYKEVGYIYIPNSKYKLQLIKREF